MADILTDGKGNGIPQYQNGSGEYLPLVGDKAPYTQVIDSVGNQLFTVANPAQVAVTNLPTTQNVRLVESSAQSAGVVTPNDSADLTGGATKGIYVGSTGAIKVDMADGTTVTFNSIAPGIVHPLSVRRVHASGTTADLIIAVY